MLNKLRAAKAEEIMELARKESAGTMPLPCQAERPDFRLAIASPERIGIIAEYKRASPSRGSICPHLEVEDVVCQYRDAGAAAISILTERKYFDGQLEYIDRAAAALKGSLPLLRKDFIFDRLQIAATAATRASALLLIARFMSSAKELRQLREYAESFQMAAVIEVFDEADLRMAREAGATIIQVNARDLERLTLERELCYGLISRFRPESGEIWIAASGMENQEHLRRAWDCGYNAALIGTALMAGGKPGHALSELLKKQC